jgi:hypothetical protein
MYYKMIVKPYDNDIFFSNTSSIIFIIAIICYLYIVISEYRDDEIRDTHDPLDIKLWKCTFFIMLIGGFFISSYKLYN